VKNKSHREAAKGAKKTFFGKIQAAFESLRKPGEAMSPKTTSGVSDGTGEVILYCTQWFPSCASARAFLKEHHVQYQEIDIQRDREAAARVRGWARGNETTPTFDIGGKIVVDWDKKRVCELLGII
jgi:glutaredoxin 3